MEETVALTPRKEKTAVSVPEAPPVLAELVASTQQTDFLHLFAFTSVATVFWSLHKAFFCLSLRFRF